MRHLSSLVLALSLTAGFVACAGDEETSGSNNTGCTPGQQTSCACPGGIEGVQVCSSDGASFGACECNAAALCGNGTVDDGEECDDGNTVNDDACSNICRTPFCGDGIVQEGEDCDDAGVTSGELDTCPSDCQTGGAGGGGTGGGGGGEGGGGSTTACTSTALKVFAGLINVNEPAPNTYSGSAVWGGDPAANNEVGIDAGNARCAAKYSGSKVCTYAQLRIVDAKPVGIETTFNAVPAATTLWLLRTTNELINAVTGQPDPAGVSSTPGAGGRCNDFQYNTGHLSDGEYAEFATLGNLTYYLDDNTTYDGSNAHSQPGKLECNVMRAIPCCNPCDP